MPYCIYGGEWTKSEHSVLGVGTGEAGLSGRHEGVEGRHDSGSFHVGVKDGQGKTSIKVTIDSF